MGPLTPLAAGALTACAQSVSEVWCWGGGEAGCNFFSELWRPCVGVAGIEPMSLLSLGAGHGCAASDRTVTCWGSNASGQLGGTLIAGSNATRAIEDTLGVMSVAAGELHSCAVVGGVMNCWGSNAQQQVGIEERVTVFRPAQVFPTINDFLVVAAGDTFNCALRRTGAVLCWGSNESGQLGGAASMTSTAELVSPLSTWHREGER
jgi:alpha-tubulin suppressor-like RCC1 family protein